MDSLAHEVFSRWQCWLDGVHVDLLSSRNYDPLLTVECSVCLNSWVHWLLDGFTRLPRFRDFSNWLFDLDRIVDITSFLLPFSGGRRFALTTDLFSIIRLLALNRCIIGINKCFLEENIDRLRSIPFDLGGRLPSLFAGSLLLDFLYLLHRLKMAPSLGEYELLLRYELLGWRLTALPVTLITGETFAVGECDTVARIPLKSACSIWLNSH